MELSDWMTVQFVPATKARTAYFTHPEGFPENAEEVLAAQFEVLTEPVVGMLVQHRFVDDFPHPEKTRVVPAVPYNDWEAIVAVEEVAEPRADLVFVGVWADTDEYPQEQIDASIFVTRRRMTDRLKKKKVA